jgi:hypothetical protein
MLRNFSYHCATVFFGLIFLFAMAATIGGWNDPEFLGSFLSRVIAVSIVMASLALTAYTRILRRKWLRREGIYLSIGFFHTYYDEQLLGVRGLGRLTGKYSPIGEPSVFDAYSSLQEQLENNEINEAEFRKKVDELMK